MGAIAPVGGLGVWMYRRQNRKLKDVEVEKARLEAKADDWHIWKEQCDKLDESNQHLIDRNDQLVKMNADKEDRYQADLAEKEERFNKQTDFLRGIQRQLVDANREITKLTAHIGHVERERDHYKQWFCKKPWKRCRIREPEQTVKPDHYTPLEPCGCEECGKEGCADGKD